LNNEGLFHVNVIGWLRALVDEDVVSVPAGECGCERIKSFPERQGDKGKCLQTTHLSSKTTRQREMKGEHKDK
jgi:hypothetical protein